VETVRLFTAIDIGEEIREQLDGLQRRLKKLHANVRWVRPKSIHLTLTFLGNVPIDKTDSLKAAIDPACREIKCFEIEAAGVGTFGRPGHPRVIWAGIAACPPLTLLQQNIAEALLAAEIDFDPKPFSPHLTLGRVKGIDRHTNPLLEKIEKCRDAPIGRTCVDHAELIQSTLTPHGAEYTTLHKAALA
jgi:2'-5' RNA ligase